MNIVRFDVKRGVLRYGAAVFAVFIGLGVRLAIEGAVGGSLATYITFYPAVMLVALLAGFWPGLLATVVTLAVTIIWILETTGQFAITQPIDRVGVVLFFSMGLLMSAVAELYRRSRRRTADFQQQLELRESQERLQLALDAAKAGSWTWDMVSGTLEWSPELFRLFGLDPSSAKASFDCWQNVILLEDRPVAQDRLEQAIQKHERLASEYRIVLPAGEVRWINALGNTTYDSSGKPVRMSGICLDITERKRSEEELLRVNRTLKALSDSSQALLRVNDEAVYLQEVCRIVMGTCGYSMAWVGFAENDEDKSVRPVASAGFEAGYLDTLKITWAETERGRGPTGTAIRTGRVCQCLNMLTDPKLLPWREQAVKRGYASSIALPLMDGDRSFGALTIYAREPNGFSDEEVKLLTDLSTDFAHGIAALRLRTAKQLAEAALRESETRLRLTLDAAHLAMWDWDTATGNVVWNEEHYRMLGYEPESFQPSYDKWAGRVYPEDLPGAEAAIRRTMEEGGDYVSEFRVCWPDGTVRLLEARGRFDRDATGKTIRNYGVMTDVTERKRTEEALRDVVVQKQSAEYARTLIEVSIDPLITISLDGKITDVNEATIKATGVARDKLIGTDFSSYFTEPEKARDGYRQVFAKGFVTDYPLTIRHQDGRLMNVLYNASVYKDAHGKVLGVFAAARDVTVQKQAEAERERYQQRLRELAERLASTEERERRRISNQIHDTVIQTLSLTNIKLGSIRKGLVDSEQAEQAEEVNHVRSLLEEAIKESRSLMAELTPPLLYELGLAPALQDLTERLQKLHGTPICVRDDGQLKPINKLMQGLLFEAARELIVNALKHAGRSAITVNLSRDDDRLRICVEDNGPGFTVPEDGRFVFNESGGFGLFSIRERLDQIGGKLDIHSQPGKGTTATIFVPLNGKA